MEGQVSACNAGVDTLELAWTLKPPSGSNPPTDAPEVEPGNIPRISRLMALAIKFDDLIRRREVDDYATLARLGHVTRARITQIMALLNLAPDIQEAILFLPRVTEGQDRIKERWLRPLAGHPEWAQQRQAWRAMLTWQGGPRGERPAGRSMAAMGRTDAEGRGNAYPARRATSTTGR